MSVRAGSHIEMCSFLHGSTFLQWLRYRLGSPTVDPKAGDKEWPLQKPNAYTPRFFVGDNLEQMLGHRMRGYGKDAGHGLFVPRVSKALREHAARAIELADEDGHRGEPPWHNRREKNHSRPPLDTSLLMGR